MADEENQEATEEAVKAQEEPKEESQPHVSEKPKHQPVFVEDESGRNEAQIRMEEEKKKRMAKMEEEMKEFEEMRKEEKEKLMADIADLRAKREQRKQERAEEEKRLAELRAVEEQKRRAEEEVRQRRKREEEARRQEEREKKKKEAEERSKSQSQRNFTISKKSGSEAKKDKDKQTGPADNSETKQTKTKEQLEAEKKVALEQRIQPLSIDGFGESQLQEKAKELFNKIYSLQGDKYDLEQRFKAQNVEIMELTERDRQNQKGGQKGTTNKVQTSPDPLSEKLSGIPPKIVMYSQYERVKDRRGFNDRQDLYKGPIYGIEYERIMPKSKVVLTDQGPRVVGEIDGENHQAAAEE